MMSLKDKVLYHQIHPAKVATDVTAAVVSLILFWQHQLVPALLLHFLPPVVASALLLRYTPLDTYRQSPLGRYIKRYMTRPFEALRFIGDIIMVFAAWYHAPEFLILGLLVIIAAWCNGLIVPRSS